MVRGIAVLAAAVAIASTAWGCGALDAGPERRVRVPAALPADVPLPRGALLRSARDFGARGLTLVFETDEPVAAAQQRLRVELETGGWTLLSEVAVDGALFSSYRKSARSVALGISKAGGVTVVGLAYRESGADGGGVQG